MRRAQLLQSLMLLFALAPLAGCMTGPANQYVLKALHEKISPEGWTLRPFEHVKLQVLNPQFGWVTVQSTRTDAESTPGDGTDWYYYQISNATIPSWGWSFQDPNHYRAQARMVGADSQSLYTFNANVWRQLDPVNGSKGELLANAGCGKPSFTFNPQTKY